MTNPVWSKVGIDLSTVLGDAIKIESINKTTGVLTYSGAVAPVGNSSWLLFEVNGMGQMHNRVVRIKELAGEGKTFKLDGLVELQDYDDFLGGTAREITFGASFRSVTNITFSGGEPEMDDDTTVHDSDKVERPVRSGATKAELTCKRDLGCPGLKAARRAHDVMGMRAIRVRYANGDIVACYGYVAAPGGLGGSAPGKVTTNVSLAMVGKLTDVPGAA